jgi:hypothetical protein
VTWTELAAYAARHGEDDPVTLISKLGFDRLCAEVAEGIMSDAEASGELEAFLR